MDGTVLHVRAGRGGTSGSVRADDPDAAPGDGDRGVSASDRAVPADPSIVEVVSLSDATPPLDRVAGALDGADCAVLDAGELDGHADERDDVAGTDRLLDALDVIRERRPALPVVVHSVEPDGDLAAAATRRGATEYHHAGADASLADRVSALRSADAKAPDEMDDGAPTGADTGASGVSDSGADPGTAAERDGGEVPDVDALSARAGDPLFEVIAEHTTVGVVVMDAESRIVYANDGLATISGYDRETLVGGSFTRLVPADLEAAHRQAVERYCETGQRTIDWEYLELPLSDSDGDRIPTAVSFGEVTVDGDPYFTGIIRDVSERAERERELEETTQLLDQALESTDAGVFAWTVGSDEGYWHESAARLFGLDPDPEYKPVEAFADCVHPDDRERVRAAVQAAVEGDPLEVTYRVERDGERWFETLGEVVTGPDGDDRLVGVTRDVTERRRSERERSRNEAALRDLQRLASAGDRTLEGKLTRAIEIGCDRLDLPQGFVAEVDEAAGTHRIVAVGGDEPDFEVGLESSLDEVYCRQTVADDGALAVIDAPEEGWAGTTPYEATGVRCYFGARLETDEGLYGTLGFAAAEARDRPFSEAERTFVELLAEWVGHEIERVDRERRLREARERLAALLETARAFMTTSGTREVAGIVADATGVALGYEVNVVRLYDPETGLLEPVARSSGEADPGERPAYAVGEGGPGLAFERGEVIHRPSDADIVDSTATPADGEVAYVPLGERGVLTVDSGGGRFDEADLSMLETLASNAAVALERVAREEELTRYETVIENVQDMVYVVDETERFSLVTDPLAEWLGYDREELIGAHPGEVLEAAAVDAFEAEIAALWRAAESDRDGSDAGDGAGPDGDRDGQGADGSDGGRDGEGADGGGSRDGTRRVETEFLTADGEARPGEVEVSLLPSSDGFAGTVGVVRDRSELVETRRQLEDERDRFSYLFDNLPDAVVEVAFEGSRPHVRSVNTAFTDLFGYEAEAVRGEPLNDYVLPPDSREEGRQLDAEATEGRIQNREVRRKTARGYRDFLFRGVPYRTDGSETRAFGIYADITERKERQRRLEVLNRVLRHNLRNDLNVVLGYADMLVEALDEPDLAERALALREKAEDLAALGDRARQLERTVGSGSPREREIDIGSVVESAVGRARDAYPDLSVETDVSPATVVGDSRLELAVSELLENAAEHAGGAEGAGPAANDATRDGPTVRVETVAVEDDAMVGLRIADDGPGIPATERQVVGDEAEITQLRHGTGIGLWVAKWTCESCGGRMRFVESPLDGGAVLLELPRA